MTTLAAPPTTPADTLTRMAPPMVAVGTLPAPLLARADTAVALPDGYVYVFDGDCVWRSQPHARRVDPDGPAPISRVFPGAFGRHIDAALLHPDGSLYLFRGRQHLRYNLAARRPETGYPRAYAADWPGVFPGRIDAALAWAPDVIYFFAAGTYTSFSPSRGTTRSGYPKPIAGNWPGLGVGPVRVALCLPGDQRLLVAGNGLHRLDREGALLESEIDALVALGGEDEVLLQSRLLRSSADLKKVANGLLRLGRASEPATTVPLSSRGPAVRLVQQALQQRGMTLPLFGADGGYGAEAAHAVLRYNTCNSITGDSGAPEPIVGAATITHLDHALSTPRTACTTCQVQGAARRCQITGLTHGTGEAFVLIPGSTTETAPPAVVDVLFHFHGHGAGYHELPPGAKDTPGVLQPGEHRDIDLYHLDTQLAAIGTANGRLTIAVLPQSSDQVSHFGDLHEQSDAFLQEVLTALVASGTWKQAPRIGNVVVSAHSGGGYTARQTAESLAKLGSGAHFGRLAGLLLFDAVHSKEGAKYTEVDAARDWLSNAIGADVRALKRLTTDAAVDAYFDGRPRFRGSCSHSASYPEHYKRLDQAIKQAIAAGQSSGLSSHALAKLQTQYQVFPPVTSPPATRGPSEPHERLLGTQRDPGKRGVVFEALEGLPPPPGQTSSPQPELELEEESETPTSAPPPIPPATPPRAVPTAQPIPFAPDPPAGAAWPIWTHHPSGRQVSYETTDGATVGTAGRRFLADRTTKSGQPRWHVGVDLFANRGDPVVACEDGQIIFFGPFTQALTGRMTHQLLIAHAGCVVNYGEVTESSLHDNGLAVHAPVRAGQRIGAIGDTGMLHLETYRPGTTTNHQWLKHQAQPPAELLNPTRYLLALQAAGLGHAPAGSVPDATAGSIAQRIEDALNAGQWLVALGLALLAGRRDESVLTDMLFYARHRELAGRRIAPGETHLAAEWRAIRDQLVRPALRQAAPPPPSTPSTAADQVPGLSPAESKALRITSTFETGRPMGFDGLTGDFDNMGLSFGLMQWNIGTGSLQPLLVEFARQHADRFAMIFGLNADTLRDVLQKPLADQLAWARSINEYTSARSPHIREPWATAFHHLAADAAFQQIQLRHVRPALDRAAQQARQFGLRSERAFAFLFDVVTGHGAGWLTTDRCHTCHDATRGQRIAREQAAWQQRQGRPPTESELLSIMANVIADTVLPRWRNDVLVRRLAIINGHGHVHGQDYDLTRQFNLTDAPWERP